MTRGQMHYIADDVAGNLGIAWMVAFCDWVLIERWVSIWS